MSDIAIRVEGLSKQYRIGARKERYRTFRDTLAGVFSTRSSRKDKKETVWALKDVSFEVPCGEVVGIIGRNGAGKSTLLKVLSRITEPSCGHARIYGRLGSLLEVGTGFHPELTGRENIYLNGAILGMKRNDIEAKFEQIVEFSEVNRFIDTPVKHYSSGMYLRLAFAVAAHLEPDVLLVDEVLAVGDVGFQKKCIGKMGEVARDGRTVLVVSHNMAVVSTLCKRAVLLDKGALIAAGDTSAIIKKYISTANATSTENLRSHPGRKPTARPIFSKVALLRDGHPSSVFSTYGPFQFEVHCANFPPEAREVSLGFDIKDSLGVNVCASNMSQYHMRLTPSEAQVIRASVHLLPITPGMYTLSLYVGNGTYDWDVVEGAIAFEVTWESSMEIPLPPRPPWGPVAIKLLWEGTPEAICHENLDYEHHI